MSLDMAKLEKVRQLGGGIVQAQCPACKEGGGDKKGEHLRIYPDGRYGCCVHPKSREHRKRIFALAGGKVPSPGTFTVKVKAPRALIAAKSVKAALTQFTPEPPNGGKQSQTAEKGGTEVGNGVQEASTSRITDFGTLGTGNSKSCAYAREDTINTDIESVEELKDLESAVPNVPDSVSDHFGTLGTPISKSCAYAREDSITSDTYSLEKLKDLESGVPNVPSSSFGSFGTPGTGNSKSCAYAREDNAKDTYSLEELKDLESGVPSVPTLLQPAMDVAAEPPSSAGSAEKPERLPYLSPDGSLIIPFDSPERYHWWKPPHEGRLSPAETLKEVQARLSRSDAGRVVDEDGEQQ